MKVEDALHLAQLNSRIKNSIRTDFQDPVWVIAEINQYNQHSSGHCYLELIEKDSANDLILASIRATIWASTFNRLSAYFKTTTGQSFAAGIKVLLKVTVDFHELYGLSLNIRDVDPSYTLGDMARKRAEVLQKLDEAGVLEMNRGLELTRVPQKIAIISSPSAAGYEDFCEQIKNNQGEFVFYWKLFPASMQGEKTGSSIISALDRISDYADFFDAVVIIRGGGSKTDLSFYDDFELAYYITQFPIPVITGIGHERDESVADIVAHTSCKTPTAVAEFLIDMAEQFESELLWLKENISRKARNILSNYKSTLNQHSKELNLTVKHYREEKKRHLKEIVLNTELVTKDYLTDHQRPIQKIENSIIKSTEVYFLNKLSRQTRLFKQFQSKLSMSLAKQIHKIELIEKQCQYLNPLAILKRGYSITYANGKPIKDPASAQKGDQITTRVSEGIIKSRIE